MLLSRMLVRFRVAILAASILGGGLVLNAQVRPTAPPARRTPPAPVDRRSPLDRTRTAYLDDRIGAPSAVTTVSRRLRAAHLWTLTPQRDRADLIVTLSTPAVPRGAQPSARARYELTVQPARGRTGAPLWHATAASPDQLMNRLKADLAPTACVAVWCW